MMNPVSLPLLSALVVRMVRIALAIFDIIFMEGKLLSCCLGNYIAGFSILPDKTGKVDSSTNNEDLLFPILTEFFPFLFTFLPLN